MTNAFYKTNFMHAGTIASALNKILAAILFCLPLKFSPVLGQAGSLDITFGADGKVNTDFGNTTDIGMALLIQPDGKLIMGGNAITGFSFTRYNTAGTIDNTYGINGTVSAVFNGTQNDFLTAAAIGYDGKAVAAGFTFNAAKLNNDFCVARFTVNGRPDNSFNGNGRVITSLGVNADEQYLTVAVQPDGKIVAAGYSGVATTVSTVIRYNTDGSLDTAFGDEGIVRTDFGGIGSIIYAITIQPDGKIIAAGSNLNAGLKNKITLARYNTDGTLDNSFGRKGLAILSAGRSATAYAVALQKNGRIAIAGSVSISRAESDYFVYRLSNAGKPDNSFGAAGLVTGNFGGDKGAQANAIAVQPDGKIIIAGTSYSSFLQTLTNEDFGLARYNTNGTPDSTFGLNGKSITDFGTTTQHIFQDYARAIVLQPDGKIVSGGSSNSDYAIVRYLNTLDLRSVPLFQNISSCLIYPNPVQVHETLTYTLLKEASISVALYNENGILMQQFIHGAKRTAGIQREELNFRSALPKGRYVLVISNGTENMSIKLIRQ